METVYDLNSRRYLAMSMNNEEEPTFEYVYPAEYFDPAKVKTKSDR